MAQLRDGRSTDADSGSNHEARAAPQEHDQTHERRLLGEAKDDKENQDPEHRSKLQPASGTKRKAEQVDTADQSETKPTTPTRSSGLRDSRPTPGRRVPPRGSPPNAYRSETDAPSMRDPSPEPPQKKKRGNMSDREFERKALKDPNHTFHDLHICYKKGPRGSPTYDEAGFQLDYDKVADWMRPKAYNKKSMVNGMERHLKRVEQERAKMAAIFFVGGEAPGNKFDTTEKYWSDRVSKDLGVAWHKVNPKTFEEWEKKGFVKQNAEDWKEVTEEERKRMSRMLCGASLRK